jgi:hypothetical protein
MFEWARNLERDVLILASCLVARIELAGKPAVGLARLAEKTLTARYASAGSGEQKRSACSNARRASACARQALDG